MKTASRTIETVGPLADYRLQYELVRKQVARPTPVGLVSSETIEFERFVILPAETSPGEPMAKALQEGSQFRTRIDRLQPDRNTISVWVYPDSSEIQPVEALAVRTWIQTATWPLSEGGYISGGPNGYHTTAQ